MDEEAGQAGMPLRFKPNGEDPAARRKAESSQHLNELASLLIVVAHPFRLMILRHLSSGVKCVKDLNDLIPTSQPNLSQHMAALREARLVESQTNGPLCCYYVRRPSLVRSLIALHPKNRPTVERTRTSALQELERLRGKLT